MKRRTSAAKFQSDPPRINAGEKAEEHKTQSQSDLDPLESVERKIDETLQRRESRNGTWPLQPGQQPQDGQQQRRSTAGKDANRDIYLLRHTYSKARRVYGELNSSDASPERSPSNKFTRAALALSQGAGQVLRSRDRLANALLATAKREGQRVAFCEFLQQELNKNVEGSGDVLDDAMETHVFHIFAGLHKLQVSNYSRMRLLIQAALNEDDEDGSDCLQALEKALFEAQDELEIAIKEDPALYEKLNNQVSGNVKADVHGDIIRTVTSIKEQFKYQRKFDAVAVSHTVAQHRRNNNNRIQKKPSVSFTLQDDQGYGQEIVDEPEVEDESRNHEEEKAGKFLLDAACGSSGLVRKARRLNSRVQGAPTHAVLRRDRISKTLDFRKDKEWRKSGTSSGLMLPAHLKLALGKGRDRKGDDAHASDNDSDSDDSLSDDDKLNDHHENGEDEHRNLEGKGLQPAAASRETESHPSAGAEALQHHATREALPQAAKSVPSKSDELMWIERDHDSLQGDERTERGHGHGAGEGPRYGTKRLPVIEKEELPGHFDGAPAITKTGAAEPGNLSFGGSKARTGGTHKARAPEAPKLNQLAALRRRLLKPLRLDWSPPGPWGVSGWEWAPSNFVRSKQSLADGQKDFNLVPSAPSAFQSRMASTLPEISATTHSSRSSSKWRMPKAPSEKTLLSVLFPVSRDIPQ